MSALALDFIRTHRSECRQVGLRDRVIEIRSGAAGRNLLLTFRTQAAIFRELAVALDAGGLGKRHPRCSHCWPSP